MEPFDPKELNLLPRGGLGAAVAEGVEAVAVAVAVEERPLQYGKGQTCSKDEQEVIM